MDVLVMEPLLWCDKNLVVFSLMQKISVPMHRVPTTITYSLFIRIGRMSNGWKVEEVNYEFNIGSFLTLYFVWGQMFKFLRLLKAAQHRIPTVWTTSKYHSS
jgi:hypothetical protein